MQRKRVAGSMLLLVTTALLLQPAPASAAVRISCGATVTVSTKLTSNLSNCPGTAIVIGADGITLDLNGHTIDGTGAGSGVENSGGFDGVTITNGSVSDFEEGVFLDGTTGNVVTNLAATRLKHAAVFISNSKDAVLEGNSSVANGTGLVVDHSRDSAVRRNAIKGSQFGGLSLFASSGVTVEGNTVDLSNESGIGVYQNSDRNQVVQNVVTGNGEGIVLADDADHNVLRGNTATRNVDGVILDVGTHHNDVVANSFGANTLTGVILVGSDDNRVADNAVVGNGDGSEGGIHVISFPDAPGAVSDRNVLSGNALSRNAGDGLLVDSGQVRTTVNGNVATQNTDDGIDIESAATTVTANRATSNGDLGIEAVRGVADGGSNVAYGNGNPAQCLNVSCRAR